MCEVYGGCEWVTENVGVDCHLVVAVDVTSDALAEGPVQFFVWDLVFLVLPLLFAIPVMIWTLFSETVDPMKFGVRGFRFDWVCRLQFEDLAPDCCPCIAFIVPPVLC
jgi:hypothetical protein